MGNFFNVDGKAMVFLSRVADLLILNIIYIICCIPIVTIGASTTALYYITMKMTKDEESYIVKGFFKAFKDNFKQATIIWLIALFTIMVIWGDIWILTKTTFLLGKILLVLIGIIVLVLLFTMIYLFPVLARFDNTIINTIKNAFLISIVNLPYSILLLIIMAVPIVLLVFFYLYVLPLFFFIGFSLVAFVSSFLYRKILDKYITTNSDGTMQ